MKEPEVKIKEVDLGYTVRTTEYGPRKGYHEGTVYWSGLDVEILKDGIKLGEYKRNYTSLFNTFVPFKQGDREYALYSSSYGTTRVMSLPDCKDICAEIPHKVSFCPTDYYVPDVYTTFQLKDLSEQQEDDELFTINRKDGTEVTYATRLLPKNFGFIAGCVWGDDTSYKVQYLDLSRISEGILIREEKFGYLELPSNMDLKDAIKFHGYEEHFPYVEIAVGINFRMDTGEAMDVSFRREKDDE